ncbi:MAG: ketose-bisphosphate aldolase [Paludibacter sp.]|nr:MAG: ketose-bisphosphate aldolase [Paludibacter sp.]
MVSYKELGFVNTRKMFEDAYNGKYVIGAFNFVCLEQMQAILAAATETRSPFILQCSANVRKYINPVMARHMAAACVEIMKSEGKEVPMALHLDHGTSYEECVAAIEGGFSSVMIDGSALPYEENVALTAKVVKYAHRHDVTVEGELGIVSGIEEEMEHYESRFTDPAAVYDFVSRTGVDSLAISIGTSHGVVKVIVKPGEPVPPLRFDILEEIEQKLPGFPIVLHGASAIPSEFVDMINKYGGKLEHAQGIPVEQVIKAVRTAVCKINIASDGWITMTATTRKALAENPDAIDPRKFLAPSRSAMKEVYSYKMREVFGSAGRV